MTEENETPTEPDQAPPVQTAEPAAQSVPASTGEAREVTLHSMEELGALIAGGFDALGSKIDRLTGGDDSTPDPGPWNSRSWRRRN